MVISLLSEEKGISYTLGISFSRSYFFIPRSLAPLTIPSSVASPFSSSASQQRQASFIVSSLLPYDNVILFSVIVPVLSLQITVAFPRASTADSFFTMAFFFAIFCTPIASTIVTTAVRPSGIAATARLTAVINILNVEKPLKTPIANIVIHIKIAPIPSSLPSLLSFFCKGVSSSTF